MSRSPASGASSLASSDHWQVLGLAPGADAATLKRAFREQARRWHPDLNGNDPVAEERFKRVNEAYAVLSDPVRQRAWESGLEAPESDPMDSDPFASGFPHFEDYLETLFGRESWQRREPSDAAEPFQEPEEFPEQEPDDHIVMETDVTTTPASPPPVVASVDQESLVELTPEQALAGQRVELELADGCLVEIWTPPLAGDGWRLRLAGVAPGGGDHFLQLRVRSPEGLRIDGLRVHYVLDLHPADAVLGCQVVVPTLEGPVRLRVPPGSSSGRLLRLRGRGQALAEQRGDQFVDVRIVVDERPTEAEEALYRRLRELDQQHGEDDHGR